MTIPTGRFVWFEYVSTDSAKAQGFFGELFNWKTQSVPMPDGAYTMIALDKDTTIGGYMPTPKGAPPHAHWLPHLQVTDAAATLAIVAANGGKIAAQPFKLGEVGTMGVALDPLGGVFAVWQPTKPMGTGDFKGVDNAWCWNELYTEDPAKSVAFYEKVAGFTDAPMDMGPMGTYHVLNFDGKSRGGVMKSPMPNIPQNWMPYVQVANVDAIAAKAKKLGADIKVPPNDAPGVGRFAVFTDPMGAPLGILQPPAGK
jgi:predicted enzyme related to lactoylglutathione lyase